MKFKRSELKRIIIEEIEKDPALVKAIAALADTIDGLDMSVDFLAAAVTGENPLSISRAQSTLGRAYRPTKKSEPAPEALKEEEMSEGAELKIPVERYDAFKRKIEQWGMLFNKFTGQSQDLGHRDPEVVRAAAPKLLRRVNKLELELTKIMGEFDLNYKSYEDERHAQRQKLDRFDGDSEFFLEEEGWPEKEGSGELDEEKENNPWAICTAQVGREDKEKYEKCVKSIKKQNRGE